VHVSTFLILVAAIFVAIFVFSLTRRRHGESEVADPQWTRTSEVFKDPSTGRLMRVWLDSRGDRHYVAEG
jgi:hypothetical protein